MFGMGLVKVEDAWEDLQSRSIKVVVWDRDRQFRTWFDLSMNSMRRTADSLRGLEWTREVAVYGKDAQGQAKCHVLEYAGWNVDHANSLSDQIDRNFSSEILVILGFRSSWLQNKTIGILLHACKEEKGKTCRYYSLSCFGSVKALPAPQTFSAIAAWVAQSLGQTMKIVATGPKKCPVISHRTLESLAPSGVRRAAALEKFATAC